MYWFPKEKKKTRKSRKESKDKDSKRRADSPFADKSTIGRPDSFQTPVPPKPPVPAQVTSKSVQQTRPKSVPVQTSSSMLTTGTDQQEVFQPGATGQDLPNKSLIKATILGSGRLQNALHASQ